jgi:hypothetical protein
MSISPLRKIVFIQKVALFAGTTPKKALQLAYVSSEWRETVVDFTFDALFFDPFIKPLLVNSTSASATSKLTKKEANKRKLESFKRFRKVISFIFEHVSAENKEILERMKMLLAFLFHVVHEKHNDLYQDDDGSTQAKGAVEVASLLNSDSLRSFRRTHEVQDLIINHIAPRVTAIYEFGGLITNIVQNRPSAELFANVESFSAILNCFHRSKTSEDACWIATSIYKILEHNPSSNKLLNSLPVVDAFSFITPLADDDDAVEWISNALRKILSNNEEAQEKFGTAEFLKIFKGMEKHAKAQNSKKRFQCILEFVNPFDFSKPLAGATTSSQLKSAVDSLPRHEKYYSSRVRDLLISKKDLIVDAETADSVVNFLHFFSKDASLFPLLQTKEVHDLVINHIAPHVTAIYEFGRMIRLIVEDEKSAELFSDVESFSAILKCFHRSKTSKDAEEIATSINNILADNPSSKKLLNSLPFVEAFSFIIPLANDAEAVRWISNSLINILKDNEEVQKKFATPEFFQIFQGMEKHATTWTAKASFESVSDVIEPIVLPNALADATNSSQLQSAVDSLSQNEKYCTEEVRDLLISKKELIVDAETADSVVKFLHFFSKDDSLRPPLQTKEVQDLIINNIAPHVTAIQEFGSLICYIVQKKRSAELFSNIESFTAILKCFHRSKKSEDARWIASAINSILHNIQSSNKLFNSLPVVDAFSFIIPLANDAEAPRLISNALLKILNNNEEAQQKFGTPEFLGIFRVMEKYAKANPVKEFVRSVIAILKPIVDRRAPPRISGDKNNATTTTTPAAVSSPSSWAASATTNATTTTTTTTASWGGTASWGNVSGGGASWGNSAWATKEESKQAPADQSNQPSDHNASGTDDPFDYANLSRALPLLLNLSPSSILFHKSANVSQKNFEIFSSPRKISSSTLQPRILL